MVSTKGWNKRLPMSEEHRRKISEAKIGHTVSQGTRRKLSLAMKSRLALYPEFRGILSQARKGKTPWIKGRHHTEEAKQKMSLARKGKHTSPATEFKRGLHHTEDWKAKVAERMKGNKYTLGYHATEETKAKLSKANKGRCMPEEEKRKHSEAKKKLDLDDNYAKKVIMSLHLKPNKKEQFLNSILDPLVPHEWKYVGDGQFILGGKCPDFVNINGKKQVIELFGDYWHSEKKKNHSREQEEQQRIDHFARFSFKTLVIWEHELQNPESLKEKIINFMGQAVGSEVSNSKEATMQPDKKH